MATFPSLVSYALTASAAATTHNVTIPTGATGDLLIVCVATDAAPVYTWPAGYTQLQADTADPDSAVKTGVRYRVTDGSEGATIAVDLDASQELAAIVLRVTNYTGTPEAGTAVTTAAGTPTANPDPPSLTPSWGSADVLWVAFAANDAGSTILTGGGSIRSEFILPARSGSGAGDVHCIASVIMTTASSRDPAAFSLSGSQEWVANTFAVKGAAPAASGGGQRIFGG